MMDPKDKVHKRVTVKTLLVLHCKYRDGTNKNTHTNGENMWKRYWYTKITLYLTESDNSKVVDNFISPSVTYC